MYYKRNYGVSPRTFSGMLEDMFHNGVSRLSEEINVFSAPVNIRETETAYELQLVAPGLKKEDIKINLEKNILHISYDHQESATEQNENKWLRKEFKHRTFKRSFTMNDKIDPTAISAKYNDGILLISLAKKENAETPAKEIQIS